MKNNLFCIIAGVVVFLLFSILPTFFDGPGGYVVPALFGAAMFAMMKFSALHEK